MKKERKPESFIKKPEYPGGSKALKHFIEQHLNYPQEAIDNKVEGTVRLKIDIDRNGKVVKTHVIKGIGFGCDEEAEKIAKKLIFITNPPKSGHIIYHKELNIPFKLSMIKKPAQQVNMVYTTSSKKTDSKKKPNKPNSYSYTLNFNS